MYGFALAKTESNSQQPSIKNNPLRIENNALKFRGHY
jgi:hypothetical protein